MPDFGSMMLTNDMHFTINSLFVPYLYNSRFFISFSYDRRDQVWANISARSTGSPFLTRIRHSHNTAHCNALFFIAHSINFAFELSVWVRIYVKCCSFFYSVLCCTRLFFWFIIWQSRQYRRRCLACIGGDHQKDPYTQWVIEGRERGGKMRWKMRHDNNKIYFLWPFRSRLLARRRCRDEILFCLFKRRFSFALSTKSQSIANNKRHQRWTIKLICIK